MKTCQRSGISKEGRKLASFSIIERLGAYWATKWGALG